MVYKGKRGELQLKSYIVRIEIQNSNLLIWQRVIMLAGATFNRLHKEIQTVTNFQSRYPYGKYNLYEFDLAVENKIVTWER
jgi:hypothetical protein